MKHYIGLLLGLAFLHAAMVCAQSPSLMSYQAVIWDAAGNLVVEKEVNIRLSILQGTATGQAVYVETHRVPTNANGLVSLLIGGGNNVSGKIADIQWGAGNYFLKTETDPSGGTNFSITGTTQLVSVPYAMYAYAAAIADRAGNIITSGPGLPGQVLTLDKDGRLIWSGATYPTVITLPVAALMATSTVAGGNITADGGAPVTARGVVYGISPNPTLSGNVLSLGSGSGSFSGSLTGLTPNTVYYIRAYATNSAGTAYGNQVVFTTTLPNAPTVTTQSASSITTNSAIVGGAISSDGGANVTARGVVYGTATSPTLANSVLALGSGNGSFTGAITGLTPNTTYYFRAYATNSAGTGYGNEFSFTTSTPPSLAVLTTLAVNGITVNSASSGGNISSEGGAPVTVRGVVWSTNPNPDVTLATRTENGAGAGTFIANLSGLLPNTQYYIRAYATNSIGTAYGNQLVFNALPSSAGVTDKSGNTYNVVQIGNQIWMKENLQTTRYRNGDSIPNVRIDRYNLTSGSWLSHLNDPYYDPQFGKKYNWYAATDPRGVCPEGWHIPSADEWQVLRNFVGDRPGTKLKENNSSSWIAHWADNPTNSTNFSARGAGINEAYNLMEVGSFWSNSSLDNSNAINRSLVWNGTEFNEGELRKGDYISIRCVKDGGFDILSQEILDLKPSSVRLTGKVIPSGNQSVSINERGFVYGTSPNPTLSNAKGSSGTGMGRYEVVLQNLTPGTLYYFRAYAISSGIIIYGAENTFRTLSDSTSVIYDACGNTYKTTKIGTQTWMAENLRTWKYKNGDTIPAVRIDRYNLTTGSWLNHLNDPYYNAFWGKKYNWYAAADARGICPEGWHLPSAEEWQTLRNFLGSSPGTKLKENNSNAWNDNWADNPTNSTNFTARGAGINEAHNLKEVGSFWSNTSIDNSHAITRSLVYNSTEFPAGELRKGDYISIRCIKNQ